MTSLGRYRGNSNRELRLPILESLSWSCFPERDEFGYKRVSAFFQKDAPRAENGQRDDKNQKKHRDRLWPDPKSKPDDIRLVDEIKAIGVRANKAENFGKAGNARNDSGNADDFKETTRAGGEVAKDIGGAVLVKLQGCRIQD